MERALRLLLVEDSEVDEQLLVRELRRQGYDPTWRRVETAEAMAEAAPRFNVDLVISDYTMPGFSGLDAVLVLQASGLDVPIICVSGTGGRGHRCHRDEVGRDDIHHERTTSSAWAPSTASFATAEVRRERVAPSRRSAA